jgi:hypothetical protein
MNARVEASSGWPGERTTSSTTGGTPETEDGAWPVGDGADAFPARRCSFFLLHASHSPVGPGVPPQAHLRCSSPPAEIERETAAEFGAVLGVLAFNRCIIAYSSGVTEA